MFFPPCFPLNVLLLSLTLLFDVAISLPALNCALSPFCPTSPSLPSLCHHSQLSRQLLSVSFRLTSSQPFDLLAFPQTLLLYLPQPQLSFFTINTFTLLLMTRHLELCCCTLTCLQPTLQSSPWHHRNSHSTFAIIWSEGYNSRKDRLSF